MPLSTPNHYSLSGHDVTIDYSLSDISGQPLLNFKVDKLSGAAHKRKSTSPRSTMWGSLITVALHPGPSADEGDPQLLIPVARCDAGIRTRNRFRDGRRQDYHHQEGTCASALYPGIAQGQGIYCGVNRR